MAHGRPDRSPSHAPAPVVVAGFSITALGTLRCLAGSPYEIWLVGSAQRPGPALASRIPRHKLSFRERDGLVPFLRALRQRFAVKPALLLTEDVQVVEIAHQFPDVREHYRILLPPRELTDALMDKAKFTALALAQGYLIPRTRVLTSPRELASIGEDFAYPYLLKPYLLHSRKIQGPADLEEYTGTFEPVNFSSLIVQEWIPGGDDQLFFCYVLLDERQELVASFLGRKLRQHPPQDGTTSFGVSWRDDALVEQTVAIFRELRCQGFVSMEYKYDAARRQYFIMEPTVGRFNQQIALSMAAGVNFPRIAADTAFGDRTRGRRQGERSAAWMYEAGDLATLWRSGRARQFLPALRQADVTVLFSRRDPAPLLYKCWTTLAKAFRPARG